MIVSNSLLPARYLLAALGLPFLSALLGRLCSLRNPHLASGARLGLAIGLFGPFAVLLTLLCSWLSHENGLASLLSILACLAVALAMGALWGLIVRSSLPTPPQKDQ